MFRRCLQRGLLLLAFTALAAVLQWLAGSYRVELSGYPDEPAHLITGMMVRDYALTGIGSNPVKFAEEYYLHYPKVAFGIWPPLFHFVEGAWFLLLPPSKASAFLLQAVIMGGLALLVANAAVLSAGWILAVAAGAALICMPGVQIFTAMIMADNLMCLLAFASMLAFAQYARTESRRWAIVFGVLLGSAVITKSNAAPLAIMPVLTMLLLRRYRKMFAGTMFLAAGTSLAIAVPWQLMVMQVWTGTVSFTRYSPELAKSLLLQHLQIYGSMPGAVVFALAAIGIVDRVILPYRQRSLEPLWAAAISLVLSFFAGGMAPLPPEPRYHVASMAGLALFAAAGAARLAGWIPGTRVSLAGGRAAVAGVAAVIFGLTTFSIPVRAEFGYTEAAKALLQDPGPRRDVILVSSENYGEGMLIPEIAWNEARPGRYVLRASKVLSRSRWDLDDYQLVYSNAEDIEKYLESIPVQAVVYDHTKGPFDKPDHKLLWTVLQTDKWMHAGSYPAAGPNAAGGRIEVYYLKAASMLRGKIEIDMRYTLRRTLRSGGNGSEP